MMQDFFHGTLKVKVHKWHKQWWRASAQWNYSI